MGQWGYKENFNIINRMEVAMKILENKYSNKTFENIKHIDDYGNEYWYARELQKVL